jgi:hypothetical protein
MGTMVQQRLAIRRVQTRDKICFLDRISISSLLRESGSGFELKVTHRKSVNVLLPLAIPPAVLVLRKASKTSAHANGTEQHQYRSHQTSFKNFLAASGVMSPGVLISHIPELDLESVVPLIARSKKYVFTVR